MENKPAAVSKLAMKPLLIGLKCDLFISEVSSPNGFIFLSFERSTRLNLRPIFVSQGYQIFKSINVNLRTYITSKAIFQLTVSPQS